MTPSTDWKEVIALDEATRFEQLAQDLAGVQAAVARKRPKVLRGLHAKGNLVARAELEVLANLPAHARVGLFSEPKSYDAVVRFSNGGPAPQDDKKPDVRGIAVKVLGVGGKKLIPGMEDCVTQDFLAILGASVPFATPDDFVWFVVNARSPLTLLPKALVRLGPGGLFKLLGQLKTGLGAPLKPMHANRYFSALPIKFGAHAAKYSFVPLDAEGAAPTVQGKLGEELSRELSQRAVRWELQVQFFTDEQSTPIEDPTVEWKSPWLPVARLTVLKQDADPKLSEWGEGLSFDPWHAQEEFRPVGAMMRARNAAYRVSTQARKAEKEPTALPALRPSIPAAS